MLPEPNGALPGATSVAEFVEEAVGALPGVDALLKATEPPCRVGHQVGTLGLKLGRVDAGFGRRVKRTQPVVARPQVPCRGERVHVVTAAPGTAAHPWHSRKRTPRGTGGLPQTEASQLCADVFENRPEVGGGAELDERDAFVGPTGVAAGPVVEVAGPVELLGAVGVADVDRAGDHVTPMGALAGIAGQALEQRSEVGAGRQAEMPHELPTPLLAASHDPAHFQLDVELLLRSTHVSLLVGFGR